MADEKHPTEKVGRNPVKTPNKKKPSRFKLPKFDLKNLDKNYVLAGSLAAILIIVGVSAFILTRDSSEQLASNDETVDEQTSEVQPIGATVILTEGTLQTLDDSGEWQDYKKNAEVTEGTKFKTVGASSRAVIAFDDGSALRIDANSEVELETLHADRIEILHTSGYTYNRVLPTSDMTYIVKSADAQYQALGTAFKTAVTGDEQSVEVYHSSVIETGLNKTAKEGEKLIVKSNTTPSDNGAIKQLDIEEIKTDAFLEWNRALDENDENYKDSLGFLSDITSPEITLNATDGATILLDPNASEGTTEISGTTEQGITLTVQSKTQSGSSPVNVTVGADGAFTTPVLTAPVGSAVFEFVAKDRAGNTATKTIRITFQRKSTPVGESGGSNNSSIVLSGSLNGSNDKINLSWAFSGSTSAPDGVKLVFSKTSDPLLANSDPDAIMVSSGDSATVNVSKFESGKTYYIKACIYDNGSSSCGLYSNQITIDIP